MKIHSLFKTNKESTSKVVKQEQWIKKNKWVLCKYTKTESFRANSEGNDDMIIKTVNSVFLDSQVVETEQACCFKEAEETTSFSASTDCNYEILINDSDSDYNDGNESMEMVVKGLVMARSSSKTRLFFEADNIGGTNSILEESKPGGFLLKESVVLAMESKDPYVDFRKSMEEMVESHGIKDWKGLEELLCWYLKVNCKKNHGFIISAFVDLILGIANSAASSTSEELSTSFSSAVSSFSASDR